MSLDWVEEMIFEEKVKKIVWNVKKRTNAEKRNVKNVTEPQSETKMKRFCTEVLIHLTQANFAATVQFQKKKLIFEKNFILERKKSLTFIQWIQRFSASPLKKNADSNV